MLITIRDILSTPALLVGVVVLFGLLLQKKPIEQVIKGTVTAIVGFVLLSEGSSFLQTGALKDFGVLFNYDFHIQGVVPNMEAVSSMGIAKYATDVSLIMFFGMIANMVMARFGPFHYIFLTGHHTLYMACLLAIVLYVCQMSGWQLSFMRDTTVEIFVVMTIVFLVLTAIAVRRPEFATLDIAYKSGQYHNWIIYAVVQGASFSAAIYIILAGVRLVIGEIVPAFKGIAKKIVPHAKPAVDCPILFSYAPNAVMIGFLMSFLGGVVVMACLLKFNSMEGEQLLPVIVPGVVVHFFCGGTAGVFANSEGGVKGCVIGSFVHGVLITFLSLAVIPVLGTLDMSGTTFSDADFCAVGIVLGNIANHVAKDGMLVLAFTVFILPIFYQFSKKFK